MTTDHRKQLNSELSTVHNANPNAPQLAEGTELIGEYQGSGSKEPTYIVRRADGQVIQLSRLLYLVVSKINGQHDFGQIAEQVSQEFGRSVSADNVHFLVEKKLRPLGVLAAANGASPKLKHADPTFGLKFRAALIPKGAVNAIATIFRPLFLPPVVIAVLGAFITLDLWLFFVHGISQSLREILYQPTLFLMVFGLLTLSALFHECGHATACRYGGAKPGVMGVGIYIVWLVYYTNVTDAYRLNKAGRLRTDLGGVYFNVIFALMVAGIYFLTGFEPLLALILIQHIDILNQFMPFVRLDGYYVVSDLTGVPNLYARIKPVLKSFIPGQKIDERVKELKPWVRKAVIAWVLATIPILIIVLTIMAVNAPWVLSTAWDSLYIKFNGVLFTFGEGMMLHGIKYLVEIVLLVVPVVGTILIFGLIGKRLGMSVWKRLKGKFHRQEETELATTWQKIDKFAGPGQPLWARIELFNQSEHTWAVAAISKALGFPSVKLVTNGRARTELTFVWQDLCWRRYVVDNSTGDVDTSHVYLVEKGDYPEEDLLEAYRQPNALTNARGQVAFLHPSLERENGNGGGSISPTAYRRNIGGAKDGEKRRWRRPSRVLTSMFLAALVLVGVIGWSLLESSQDQNVTSIASNAQKEAQEKLIAIHSSSGKEATLTIELAETPAQRERGLMGRLSLAEDAGMLFVYDRPQQLSLWMKDTFIPLSVAFISEDERIVDIQDMQPLDETRHASAEPAKYALEVNQGFFEKHGVEVGDRVELSE